MNRGAAALSTKSGSALISEKLDAPRTISGLKSHAVPHGLVDRSYGPYLAPPAAGTNAPRDVHFSDLMTDAILCRESFWDATTPTAEHPALAFNVRVNVAIVGGGVAGVTSAFLLKGLGQSVALIDADCCGTGDSPHATGHAIAAPDLSLSTLVETVGDERARCLWEAGGAALSRIRSIVRDERIKCQFAWVPALLCGSPRAESGVRRRDLEREYEIAQALGIDASFQAAVPGIGLPAVRFEGQARLHPLNYLRVLVDRLPGAGSYVFEDTHVDVIEGEGPFTVRAGEYKVTADYVIVAAQVPFDDTGENDRAWRSRLRVARTYVVAARGAADSLGEGLYWTMGDRPHGCLRVDSGEGGITVFTGGRGCPDRDDDDPRIVFQALARRLGERVPGVETTHHWSGCVVESDDGLPFVGETTPGRCVVTALGENNLVFGTLAGMIAADTALRRPNPWRELFSLDRCPGAYAHSVQGYRAAGLPASRRLSGPGGGPLTRAAGESVVVAYEDGALPPGCPY